MSTVSKWIMAAIVAAVIVAMLRNPAGATGIIIAGGTETQGILGVLAGGGGKPQRGNFAVGQTRIALG